jgi:hypothetical protein
LQPAPTRRANDFGPGSPPRKTQVLDAPYERNAGRLFVQLANDERWGIIPDGR